MKNTIPANGMTLRILFALSMTHLFNDAFQSIIMAVYPVLKDNLLLSFSQIGLITLVYQFCASVFQPFFGLLFDKKPSPWYLILGTFSTAIGLSFLAYANSLFLILVSVAFVGLGSSVIHPEASRLTHLASGGRHGFAQSIFQVGGNLGSSLGPLLAALIIAPYGQHFIIYFAIAAFVTALPKIPIFKWYNKWLKWSKVNGGNKTIVRKNPMSRGKIILSLLLLLVLIFSKYVYMASLNSFYTFYLMEKFNVTIQQSQFYLFAFLFAVASGTLVGGPVGDRFGRKLVIWVSILGTAPFSLLLPYMNLFWTCILTILIGFILSSAFSAILVYAQELLPQKVGLISGLFFGLAFGIAGIAAAVLGSIADIKGIEYVYKVCAYLPLLGIVTAFLPNAKSHRKS